MKILAVAAITVRVVSFSFTASSVTTASRDAVTLVHVPHGGVQLEAVVDSRGVLHVPYFAGEPRAGDLF